jgi:hypothetical protein
MPARRFPPQAAHEGRGAKDRGQYSEATRLIAGREKPWPRLIAAISDDDEYAGVAYAVDQVKKLPGRAAKPVELGDGDDIAGLERSHKLRELRAISTSAADFLAEDRASPGSLWL